MLRTVIDTTVRMDENNDRLREFTISTERKDGHGTVIPLKEWDISDFNRSGAFYYQHLTNGSWSTSPDPDFALGPATAKMYGDHLAGIGIFETEDMNPLAEKILKKVDFGTMKTTSVGFVPETKGHWGDERDNEDPEVYYFGAVRLVEWSIVHVPSNPDAVKKSIESMSKFMHSQIETHTSEGFKRDYKFKLLKSKIIL